MICCFSSCQQASSSSAPEAPKTPQQRVQLAWQSDARPSGDSDDTASAIATPMVLSMDRVRSSALFEASRVSVSTAAPRPSRLAGRTSGSAPIVVATASASTCVRWTLPQGAMQRLNVVDGAPVNPAYITGLEPGVEVDSALLESQDRSWRQLHGIKLSVCMVTQHVGLVRHHLRGGDQHSHHHEIWRMFLVHAPANAGAWLWPVGRESDFKDLDTLDLFMVPHTVFKEGITWLNLSNQQLTTVPPNLAEMTSLQRLELQCNRLTIVPDEIAALTALDFLALHNNNIRTVTSRLPELTCLRWLSLNANELTEVPQIPASMERLSLHMNAIETVEDSSWGAATVEPGGGGQQQQPDGGPLSRLPKLLVLSLFTNKVPYLPPLAVGSWLLVNKLALQRNRLDVIPDEIGNLSELEDLWVYGNRLTRLPDTLGKLTKLRKLWANNNQLLAVPESLGNCGFLEDLYLANNQLTELPVEAITSGCTSLGKLQLGGNIQLDTSALPAALQEILV